MNPAECKRILHNFLRENITNDYILLDLPYYANVGDVLIWQSTIDLLKEIPYKCLYSASIESYAFHKISEDVIILFLGGGNFGDVWKRHQIFRQHVLKDYPKNPIIQLPQSVCFRDEKNLRRDIDIFMQHQAPVTFCLRDKKSYDFMVYNYPFATNVLLPDMVLSFDVSQYVNHQIGKGILYLRRDDREKREGSVSEIPLQAERRDWPTMEHKSICLRGYSKIFHILKRIDNSIGTHIACHFADVCFKYYFKNHIINNGLRFVNTYETVYTTRLHVGIISALMGKPTIMLDNSYGKISGVYKAWMLDWKNVKM